MAINFISPEKVDLKNNKEINEALLRDKIAKEPSIIGLGDLTLKDKERLQIDGGKLDLLLESPGGDGTIRYVVELQLGALDESHIIRAIKYWDYEKKKFPGYDYQIVIIAEDLTKYLGVLNIFNGFIPLIAIQVSAFKNGNDVGIIFKKVLDVVKIGTEEDDAGQEIMDRDYWLKSATETYVKMADEILEIINGFSQGYTPNYTKNYIGLSRNGIANNFVLCRPKKGYMRLEINLPQSKEISDSIANAGLEEMEYASRRGAYRIRLAIGDIKKNEILITDLIKKAEEFYNS